MSGVETANQLTPCPGGADKPSGRNPSQAGMKGNRKGRRQPAQLRQAGAAGAAAAPLRGERGEVEPGGVVGADFILRDVKAVADDAAASRARRRA